MESSVLSPWQHDGSRDIIGQALIVDFLIRNSGQPSAPPPRPQEDQSGSSPSAVTEQSEDY